MFDMSNIDLLCKQHKITYAELERNSGIGNGVIRRWGSAEKMPRLDRIIAIADYFEVSIDCVCGRVPLPSYLSNSSNLSKEEQHLIDLYKELKERDKGRVEGYIESMLQSDTYKQDTLSKAV